MRSADPPNRTVPYVNLAAQFEEERQEVLRCVDAVFARGDFIDGADIAALESELAELCGVAYAVTLNSGTDALILGMKALGIGPGDEVITPPNSFVASTAAIVQLGARPVFVDVQDDQNIDPQRIEAAVTSRTKGIMPVHLTGRVCDMHPIMDIARRHGIAVIEDAAQAVGSRYVGKLSGSFGHIGCFSAHPLKNLNAAGDGGFLTTNDARVAERVRHLRNHGLVDRNTVVEFSTVSRMDTLQAALLRMRVRRLPTVIARRRRNAAQYMERLERQHVFIPPSRDNEYNTFHTFVIQVERRDELQQYLAKQGIGTAIHYPIPIHLQPAAKSLGHRQGDFPVTERQAQRILTLPVNQFMTEADLDYVAEAVNRFHRA